MRRPTFALALLSALTGCVSAPPDGPLVEYRDGLTPITRPVKCEAAYALVAKDVPAGTGTIVEHRALKGERIGFRREADGSVSAVAPGYTLPLAPGGYAWEVVRSAVPPWHERLWCETRDRSVAAARATGEALVLIGIVTLVIGFLVLYAYAEGNTPGAHR